MTGTTFFSAGVKIRFMDRFICRIPTLPAEELAALGGSALAEASAAVGAAAASLEASKERFEADSFQAIGAEKDPAQRRALLDLKRAVKKGKLPTEGIPPAMEGVLCAVREGSTALLEAERRFEEAYGRAVREDRERIERWAQSKELAEALDAANAALAGPLRADPSALVRSEEVRQTLLKYVLRWATKTSPFGLFVGLATGVAGTAEPLEQLRVGNSRYRLIADLPVVDRWLRPLQIKLMEERALPLALTPLCFVRGDVIQFTHLDDDNLLQTREVARGAELDALWERLCRDGVCSWKEAVALLCQASAQSAGEDEEGIDEDDADAFLEQLVGVGLLDGKLPISMYDSDPLDALAGWLDGVESDSARRAARRLRRVSRAFSECERRLQRGEGGAVKRAQRILMRGLSRPTDPPPLRALMVDRALETAEVGLSSADLQRLTDALARFVRLFDLLTGGVRPAGPRPLPTLRELMGDDERVPLPEMFLRTRKAIGIGELTADQVDLGGARQSSLELPVQTAAQRRLFELAQQTVAAGRHVLELDDAAIDVLGAGEPPIAPLPHWFALHALLRRTPEGLGFVMEGTTFPPLQLAGRFALLLEPLRGGKELVDSMRAHVGRMQEVMPEPERVEWFLPVSTFGSTTASRRPRVLPRALHVFGPRPLPGMERLPAHLVELRRVPDSDAIQLVDVRTGAELLPMLHGIGNYRRFPIIMALWRAQMAGRMRNVAWGRYLEPFAQGEADRVWPRVQMGVLTLFREVWQPGATMRAALRETNGGAPFFRALNRWLDGHGAGEVVYVDGLEERLKPMPVWRTSPTSVEEVWQQLRRAPVDRLFVFAECLPEPAAFPLRSEAGHHAVEILLPVELTPEPGSAPG